MRDLKTQHPCNFQEFISNSNGITLTDSDYAERVKMVEEMHKLNSKEFDKAWINLSKEKEI